MAEKTLKVQLTQQFAWLVEVGWSRRAYWCGVDLYTFTDDPNEAVRFSRQRDAEKVAQLLRNAGLTVNVCEHGWYGVAVDRNDDHEVRHDDAASVRPLAVDSRIVAPASGAASINSTTGR
jgi:hypothetical protein